MSQRSLLLIKPNAMAHGHAGQIISLAEEAGFAIRDCGIVSFTPEAAGEFYAMHRGKEFFDRLIGFTCSGPVMALILERDHAVEALRNLIGDADPAKRARETIRGLYAEGITENAVHASDSEANAEREIALIFG